ncbi:MAG: hypothetical protein R3D84_04110 [Paracoccaceae bacterium]
MFERLSLRLRVFLFFAALALGVLALIGAGLVLAYRELGSGAVNALVQAGAVAGFGALGLIAWVWFLFDLNVAKAILTLAGKIRARAHAAGKAEMDTTAARYLGDLAPAAQAVSATLAETRNALAEAVARETTRLADEKARLEALLSDVTVGVLLCTGEPQLVFYNPQAVELLGAAGAPGLDRKLFDYLRDGPVRHAHRRLIEGGEPDAASDILCATVRGARVLSGRMRLLSGSGNGAAAGYVLTLRDVTVDLAAHAEREHLLAEIFDRVRRPAANLQTVIGVLNDARDLPGAKGLNAAMMDEIATLTRAISELGERHDACRADTWLLAQTRAGDLADGLRARIEAEGLALAPVCEDLILRCNGFEVIALLSDLAERIAGAGLARAFGLSIHAEGAGALIRLDWEGPRCRSGSWKPGLMPIWMWVWPMSPGGRSWPAMPPNAGPKPRTVGRG